MKNRREFLLNTFNNRFACKGYDPDKKVSDEDFRIIMEVARLSPSSFGYEPWQFILLNNERIKKRIYPYSWGAQAALDGASHFVVILARKTKHIKYDSDYIEYIVDEIQQFPEDLLKPRLEKFEDFQKNDFKLLESEQKLSDWASKQTYIALANMLTSAAVLGVDSTPIEGFDKDKVNKILVEEGLYNPEDFEISTMIAFGYKNRDHRPKTRRPTEEVWKIIE